MARARNIKPGFFNNEDLAECSLAARLCFAGLWTLADREGRLEDRPKRIKGELFRFDSLDVEPLLKELAHRGFILRYEVDGRGLIQVVAFHKHQNPHHREPPSDLPPPPSPRLGPDANTPKPRAPGSSDGAEAPDKPKASPGLDPPKDDLPPPLSRVDSGALIPDSGSEGDVPPPPPARDEDGPGEDDPPPVTPTAAGIACRAMRRAGLTATNPSDPRLHALLDVGVTADELAAIAAEAVTKGKGNAWSWVLAVAKARRDDAGQIAATTAAAPPDPMAWRKTFEGVQRRAAELGVKPRAGEMAADYERRVLTAHQRAASAAQGATA